MLLEQEKVYYITNVQQVDARLQLQFNSNSKIRDESKGLKDKLVMLDNGRVPKDKKEADFEEKLYALQLKVDSLKQIRKSKMNKYLEHLRQICKNTMEAGKEIIGTFII